MRVAVLAILLSGCAQPSVVSLGSGEVSFPERVDFLPTALNFSRTQGVRVVNRSRGSHTLKVTIEPPFTAPTQLEVPGGTEVSLELVFTPTVVGTATGTLFLDDVAVPVTGEGVEVPTCGASSLCDEVQFDPDSLSCVHTVKADGASCADELQCIEAGSCQSGLCAGQPSRCDDGNACTTDACAIGRGCEHLATECAPPANPCLAPSCDPLLGCGSAPVQDGTPCGAVSCALANICLAGTCRAVVPPEGFTCAPESACRGEGVCHQQACVVPAETELHPRWTYTSNDGDFRFEGITDAQGNWYWVECGGPGTKPANVTYRCTAVSVTAEGFERFRTDVISPGILQGTSRHTQLLAGSLFVLVANEGTLAAIDSTTGALVWSGPLTLSGTAQITHVNQLAEDGRGTLWVAAQTDAPGRLQSVLARVEVATGALRGSTVVDGALDLLLLDSGGAALLRRIWLAGPPLGVALQRYEPDGTLAYSAPMDSDQGPAMVLGDRLVLLDDSVRSALDGSVLEAPQLGGWDPRAWPGVAGSSTGRFRLARSTLDSLLDTLAVQRVDNGVRSQVITFAASDASDVQLTATGDALFLTMRGLWTVGAETRVHQVSRLGQELMSCRLVDDANVNPAWQLPLRQGGVMGFNGRWLAVRTTLDCPTCDFWTPPRLAFFDLGHNSSPGLSSSGWMGPHGTPAGSFRAR